MNRIVQCEMVNGICNITTCPHWPIHVKTDKCKTKKCLFVRHEEVDDLCIFHCRPPVKRLTAGQPNTEQVG